MTSETAVLLAAVLGFTVGAMVVHLLHVFHLTGGYDDQ